MSEYQKWILIKINKVDARLEKTHNKCVLHANFSHINATKYNKLLKPRYKQQQRKGFPYAK